MVLYFRTDGLSDVLWALRDLHVQATDVLLLVDSLALETGC